MRLLYASLILLMAAGCISGPFETVEADLGSLLDTAHNVIDITESQFGGGRSRQFRERIILDHIQLGWDEKQEAVELSVTGNAASIEISLDLLDLPSDWKEYSHLVIEVENLENTVVESEINIYGARNRLPFVFSLSSAETHSLELPLFDLPLTANNEDPYSPRFLKFGFTLDQPDGTLLLRDISLVRSEKNLPLPVADRFGQRIRGDWPGKVYHVEEMITDLEEEGEALDQAENMAGRDIYGGLISDKKYEATGYFRVEKIMNNGTGQWWFITPEGNLFWSLGVTGVRYIDHGADATLVEGREFLFEELPPAAGPTEGVYSGPDRMSFYAWNVLRKYGDFEAWRQRAYTRLKKWGLNTIGNWSHEIIVNDCPVPFTYSYRTGSEKFAIGGGLSDYFHPGWRSRVDSVLSHAAKYRDDPMLLGYFIDNEAGWGNPRLLNRLPENSPGREAWIAILRDKYRSLEKLNGRWNTGYSSWEEIMNMTQEEIGSDPSREEDYQIFEASFAEAYFSHISETLGKYDPNHLYLGCRFTRRLKPEHILQVAGQFCDVITVNVYALVPLQEQMGDWHRYTGRPILIGEHHLPLNTVRQVPPKYPTFSEEERFMYYQDYVRTFAEMPFSLGTHWYQWADQQLTGRPTNGENQIVGLVDVTDQPHRELIDAIRISSGQIYQWHLGAE